MLSVRPKSDFVEYLMDFYYLNHYFPNILAGGLFLVSKNNHGSLHPFSRKNSLRMIGIQNMKFIPQNLFR
jgi:hypothetical protein